MGSWVMKMEFGKVEANFCVEISMNLNLDVELRSF
jgi:hypothetical protein